MMMSLNRVCAIGIAMLWSLAAAPCQTPLSIGRPGLDPLSGVVQAGQYAYDTRSREQPLLQVDCGWNQTAHLRADGRLFVQGPMSGNGPGGMLWEVPALPPGARYTHVAIAHVTGLAIRSDGAALQFGSPQYPFPPPALPAGVRYVRASTTDIHALLLRSDNAVVAYGDNTFGQCNVPTLPPGVPVLDIQSAMSFPNSRGRSAILLADGTVRLFGDNQWGQNNAPPLPPGMTYTAMAAKRYSYTLLLRSDGQIVGFGNNAPNTYSAGGELNVPALPGGVTYTHVAAGNGWAVAARSDNRFEVWGNALPAFGLELPPDIPPGRTVVALDAGQAHATALLSDGTVLSWGHNAVMDHFVPYRGDPNLPPTRRIVHSSGGIEHTLFTYSDGTMEGFGSNIGGQIDVPPLPPGVRYVEGGAGGISSLALRSDGVIVAFGWNGFGALNVPPLPPGMTYTSMAVEHGHSIVIRSDGNAFGFGENSAGQCNVPPLPNGVTYIKAAVAHLRSLLLRSDGTIVQFGYNYSGTPMPSLPAPGTTVVDIAASYTHAVALTSDGNWHAWGSVPVTQPPPLPFGVYYVQIHGGDQATWMRRSDGLIDFLGGFMWNADHLPPPDPGTSYVQVSGNWHSVNARFSQTCTYVGFAPGCSGSLPTSRLIPRETPRIGQELEVIVRDLPTNLAIMGMGFDRLPNPIPIPGTPSGCNLHIQVDAVRPLVGQNGEARYRLPIPDNMTLLGLHFYHQALVLDPNGNALGAVISDAAEGIVGFP